LRTSGGSVDLGVSADKVARTFLSWTDKVDNRPRPPRMKKPKVTPAAHRVYTLYIQDLMHDILVDKYGTKRGTENFDYFVGKGGAYFAVGQEIQDEKAQMYLDLGERPPSDYWAETYLDVWQRWMRRPASMQASTGGANMDRMAVARELLGVAKDLMAWIPVRRDVDIGMRNKEMHDSLTSYAPKISSEMRKAAAMSLARQGFQVDSQGRLLKKEWSEYLAIVDPDVNANKYHYYVVFSFEPEPGVARYVAYNCSGRIGIIERAYDLTDKFYHGAVQTLQHAMQAVNAHMRTKLAKGYEEVPMVRG